MSEESKKVNIVSMPKKVNIVSMPLVAWEEIMKNLEYNWDFFVEDMKEGSNTYFNNGLVFCVDKKEGTVRFIFPNSFWENQENTNEEA